jgi:hypothetical protein
MAASLAPHNQDSGDLPMFSAPPVFFFFLVMAHLSVVEQTPKQQDPL